MPHAIWFCNICGEQCETENEAKGCEESHIHIAEVLQHRYIAGDGNPQYPNEISVRMKDGKAFWYQRVDKY